MRRYNALDNKSRPDKSRKRSPGGAKRSTLTREEEKELKTYWLEIRVTRPFIRQQSIMKYGAKYPKWKARSTLMNPSSIHIRKCWRHTMFYNGGVGIDTLPKELFDKITDFVGVRKGIETLSKNLFRQMLDFTGVAKPVVKQHVDTTGGLCMMESAFRFVKR